MKSTIIDGIDFSKIEEYTPDDFYKAESINHNPELQFLIACEFEPYIVTEFTQEIYDKNSTLYSGDETQIWSHYEEEVMNLRVDWLVKSAKQGYSDACYELAQLFFRHISNKRKRVFYQAPNDEWNTMEPLLDDYEKEIDKLRGIGQRDKKSDEEKQTIYIEKYLKAIKKAAKRLHPQACEDLIRCYRFGAFGIKKNILFAKILIALVCLKNNCSYDWKSMDFINKLERKDRKKAFQKQISHNFLQQARKCLKELDKKNDYSKREKLIKAAESYFKKAVRYKDCSAQYEYAMFLLDYKRAPGEKVVHLLENAADRYVLARLQLGKYHLAYTDNLEEAVKYIRSSCNCHYGNEFGLNPDKWIEKYGNCAELKKKAISGDVQSMFELSEFYIARDSWAKSENAHFWVQKAAAGGHTKAMDTVGFALFMGWREFGGLNESLAIEYMTKAAEDNIAQSADILGECYIYG